MKTPVDQRAADFADMKKLAEEMGKRTVCIAEDSEEKTRFLKMVDRALTNLPESRT